MVTAKLQLGGTNARGIGVYHGTIGLKPRFYPGGYSTPCTPHHGIQIHYNQHCNARLSGECLTIRPQAPSRRLAGLEPAITLLLSVKRFTRSHHTCSFCADIGALPLSYLYRIIRHYKNVVYRMGLEPISPTLPLRVIRASDLDLTFYKANGHHAKHQTNMTLCNGLPLLGLKLKLKLDHLYQVTDQL